METLSLERKNGNVVREIGQRDNGRKRNNNFIEVARLQTEQAHLAMS